MTIDQAKKLLGKKSENISDEIIKKDIETAEFLAQIMVDKIYNMTKEERKKLILKK